MVGIITGEFSNAWIKVPTVRVRDVRLSTVRRLTRRQISLAAQFYNDTTIVPLAFRFFFFFVRRSLDSRFPFDSAINIRFRGPVRNDERNTYERRVYFERFA